jgi:uncharacterized SAM-binding protein YcdF (DUF218 family)
MFFALSKVLWWLFAPTKIGILASLGGFVLTATRFARLGRWLMGLGIVWLALIGLTPIGAVMMQPLEDRFAFPAEPLAAPDAIVVLGGPMNENMTHARGPTAMTDAGVRMTAGVELARRFPGARLIFTGGSSDLTGGGYGEAQGAERLWSALGMPKERMLFESESRNTYENAVNTIRLAQPKPGERWLLVTSAWHMPRSMGIFRAQGVNVTPYPVDFHTYPGMKGLATRYGTIERYRQFEMALREWIGLVAYRVTGKTDALFPAP